MNRILMHIALVAIAAIMALPAKAQNYVNAQPKGDNAVPFNVDDRSKKHEGLKWGVDIAWMDNMNIYRSKRFMEDALKIVRTSFQPSYDVGYNYTGSLNTDQTKVLDERIGFLNNSYGDNKGDIELMLNCDHGTYVSAYKPATSKGVELFGSYSNVNTYPENTSSRIVKRWTHLIELSKKYYEDAGYTVTSIAPLNEADCNHGYLSYNASTDQTLFKYISQLLKSRNIGVSISGPNTCGTENATSWTNAIGADNLDLFNTHELGWHYGDASAFDQWIEFYKTTCSGRTIINDEMHNSIEGMVGLQHGLKTGIWWGQADYVRGEFCKSALGYCLGYAHNNTNWTAASVYLAPSGKIQAFGGCSERSAQATAFRFVSTERDVFFEGQGPMREYTMQLPGGTGNQENQPNAEGLVHIAFGEDIQPYVIGKRALFNKSTNGVLELKNRNTATGTHLTTGAYNITKDYCQWEIEPIAINVSGGFSYVSLKNVAGNLALDCWGSSMDDKAPIGVYNKKADDPQRWYFDYIGDGWFHIRSRISAYCLAVADDGSICQKIPNRSDDTQLWRILPIVDDKFVQKTVGVPSNVRATAQNASIKITWTNAGNKTSYSVFKSETSKPEEYELIARDIKGGEFVDNKVVSGTTYYYVVKAVDAAHNTSERSSEVSAAVTGAKGAVLEYGFERVLTDASANKNNAAALSAPEYAEGRSTGFDAMKFDGSNFLRLSTAVGSHDAITVAAWVCWTGSSTSERIFEFAEDADNYFCLTPNSAKICVNGSATTASMTSLTKNTWTHVAVTLDGSNMKIYVGGTQKATKACTQKPSDFMPYLNAIGSGQASDAANFNGMIDNFHVYNYAMTASEINTLKGDAEDTSNKPEIEEEEVVDNTDYPVDYTDKVTNPTFDDGTNGWTFTVTSGNPNKGIAENGNEEMGTNCIEYWMNSSYTGSIHQTINNLPDGTYEFKALAIRSGGGGSETVYLYANDTNTLVNQTPAKTYTTLVEVTDGKLTIGIKQESWAWYWMAMNDVELYYYGNTDPEDIPVLGLNKQFRDLKASIKDILADETYAIIGGKERSDLAALMDMTVTDKTETGYNTAINTINNGINTFKNALPQYQFYKQELDNADKLGLNVTTEHTLFNNSTTTAATLQNNFPALYEKVNAEIDRVYDVDYNNNIGDVTTWNSEMATRDDQHWSGTTKTYFDTNVWAAVFHYARKAVTLPAGRYALRGVARSASSAVDVRLNAMGQSMRFPIKADGGYGVTTSGEKSFNTSKSYANGGGRGWEYRNILFDLDKEQEIDLEFNIKCDDLWFSVATAELWRANDVVDLTITSAGYSTLILPFDASIPNGLRAFKCSDHTTDQLVLVEAESLEANTPYVIQGTAGTYTFKGLGNITQDSYTDGFLTGVYVDTKAPMNSYVLQKLDGQVAFYKVTEGQPTVKANRVYVTIPASEVRMLGFRFDYDDGTTGIETAEQETDMNSIVDVYTVTGVKVSSGKTLAEAMRNMRKNTIYIVNGKKFIMK